MWNKGKVGRLMSVGPSGFSGSKFAKGKGAAVSGQVNMSNSPVRKKPKIRFNLRPAQKKGMIPSQGFKSNPNQYTNRGQNRNMISPDYRGM